MTKDEVIEKLSTLNRAQVARDTGLDYMWLYCVQKGKIKDPGSQKLDLLRSYLLSREFQRPQ